MVSTFFPSNSKIISPAFIPPLAAGLPSDTLATKAPLGSSSCSISAISLVTSIYYKDIYIKNA